MARTWVFQVKLYMEDVSMSTYRIMQPVAYEANSDSKLRFGDAIIIAYHVEQEQLFKQLMDKHKDQILDSAKNFSKRNKPGLYTPVVVTFYKDMPNGQHIQMDSQDSLDDYKDLIINDNTCPSIAEDSIYGYFFEQYDNIFVVCSNKN